MFPTVACSASSCSNIIVRFYLGTPSFSMTISSTSICLREPQPSACHGRTIRCLAAPSPFLRHKLSSTGVSLSSRTQPSLLHQHLEPPLDLPIICAEEACRACTAWCRFFDLLKPAHSLHGIMSRSSCTQFRTKQCPRVKKCFLSFNFDVLSFLITRNLCLCQPSSCWKISKSCALFSFNQSCNSVLDALSSSDRACPMILACR